MRLAEPCSASVPGWAGCGCPFGAIPIARGPRRSCSLDAFTPSGHPGIPTGFRPKAQGCEAQATLGYRPTNIINPNGVAAIPFSSIARDVCHNLAGVVNLFRRIPRVARSSQPWADGHNPFGIGKRRFALHPHIHLVFSTKDRRPLLRDSVGIVCISERAPNALERALHRLLIKSTGVNLSLLVIAC